MDTETVEAPVSGKRIQRKVGERGPTISILAKVKARNLYLNQGLSIAATAKEVCLAESTVRKWVERDGWRTERQASYSRLVAKTDAQAEGVQKVMAEAIASEAEENALSAMRNVRESLTRSDEFAAKDFQAYTAGVKNLASTARMLRDPAGASPGEGTTNFNLFFMQTPGPSIEKTAEKVAEPIDVKSVT